MTGERAPGGPPVAPKARPFGATPPARGVFPPPEIPPGMFAARLRGPPREPRGGRDGDPRGRRGEALPRGDRDAGAAGARAQGRRPARGAGRGALARARRAAAVPLDHARARHPHGAARWRCAADRADRGGGPARLPRPRLGPPGAAPGARGRHGGGRRLLGGHGARRAQARQPRPRPARAAAGGVRRAPLGGGRRRAARPGRRARVPAGAPGLRGLRAGRGGGGADRQPAPRAPRRAVGDRRGRRGGRGRRAAGRSAPRLGRGGDGQVGPARGPHAPARALRRRLLPDRGGRPDDPRLHPGATGPGRRPRHDLQGAARGRGQPHRQAPGDAARPDAHGLRLRAPAQPLRGAGRVRLHLHGRRRARHGQDHADPDDGGAHPRLLRDRRLPLPLPQPEHREHRQLPGQVGAERAGLHRRGARPRRHRLRHHRRRGPARRPARRPAVLRGPARDHRRADGRLRGGEHGGAGQLHLRHVLELPRERGRRPAPARRRALSGRRPAVAARTTSTSSRSCSGAATPSRWAITTSTRPRRSGAPSRAPTPGTTSPPRRACAPCGTR